MPENQTNMLQANILIVDDTPDNLRLLMNILAKQNYNVRLAPNGPRALSTVEALPPDLILLDIKMPNMSGYEVCERLKADDRARDIPVLFLSALDEMEDKLKGFEVGGVDYITKPFQTQEVLARVRTHLKIQQLQRQFQEQNTLLDEQNARFRALSEATFEGIILHDNGQILDVNQRIEEIFGHRHAELIGKHILNVIAPDCHATVSAHIRDGDEGPYEVQGGRKDGSVFPLEIQTKNMPYHGRDAGVAAVRDVSAQKAMEARTEQLRHENVALKTTMKERYRFGDIIGRSPGMQAVYEVIARASATDAHVVVYGESGTGKDLIARMLHQLSRRRNKAFVPVNCGGIPEGLVEREFFGHREGAFTGASSNKPGFFDAADKGILFLDEIGNLPLIMQGKLLRAIEGNGYTPVGGQGVRHSDVRIIAATNSNLKEQVAQGIMRADFFYRINVIPINVPPLRERREDIPLLVEHFLQQYGNSSKPPMLPGKILALLCNYDWPGNIRQLQNVVQRYLALNRLDFGDGDDAPGLGSETELSAREMVQHGMGLREVVEHFEKQLIIEILQQQQGYKKKTARMLQIPPRTLRRKLEKYQLT